jgi:hypothetical protein
LHRAVDRRGAAQVADFDDAGAFDALASPAGQATAADVPNYATRGAVLLRFDVREGEPATPGG